jgi:tetratricopeptide (TPR) repeat protein
MVARPSRRSLEEAAMSRLSLLRTAGKVALGGALLFATSTLHAQNIPTRTLPDTERPAGASSVSPSAYQFRTDPPLAEASAVTVGVHELAVPPKALKEFERSMKAFQSSDVRAAAGHLEKAIKIAPDFAQAHNNLGAMYINLRDYKRAMAELQKTIDLDPKLESPYHNLAMLMIFLGRLPEAEAAARHAMELDVEGAVSRCWLGRILVMERKSTPEAEQLLTQAATQIPEAMLWLTQILQNRGEINAAIAELQAYLQVSGVDKRDKVETWLAQLAKVAASKNGTFAEHQGT